MRLSDKLISSQQAQELSSCKEQNVYEYTCACACLKISCHNCCHNLELRLGLVVAKKESRDGPWSRQTVNCKVSIMYSQT